MTLVSSCSTKYLTSFGPSAKSMLFNEMTSAGEIADYGYIDKRNTIEYSDSVTALAGYALERMLETEPESMMKCKWYMNEPMPEEIVGDVNRIADYIWQQNQDISGGMWMSGATKEFISRSETKYVMFILSSGFTRRAGNYAGQVAKNVGLGIATALLTGCAYYNTPIKYRTDMTILIIDKETCEVVYFNRNGIESDPTDMNSHYNVYMNCVNYFSRAIEALKKKESKNK